MTTPAFLILYAPMFFLGLLALVIGALEVIDGIQSEREG